MGDKEVGEFEEQRSEGHEAAKMKRTMERKEKKEREGKERKEGKDRK